MTGSVRALSPADIPACMRLKEAAGWNQTEIDWHNVMRLAPETCFGVECDGGIVATATAVSYGRKLAWIGMVLTHPDYRRRGFARALMEHTLDAIEARGVEWIKLDGTDMGAPLYRDLGFEDECAIERWAAPPRSLQTGAARPFTAEDWAAVDGTAFGANRGRLLETLAPLGAAAVPEQGYAIGRPGSKAAYFGPCVARSVDAARQLLRWFLASHPNDPVFWDLLPGNIDAVTLAHEFGFEPVRRLVRMVRRGVPDPLPFEHDDTQVFAIAGFEYG
jgi:GNAT superfamily N-acetyltransferase